MINGIKKEIIYVFWLCAILAWGLMLCDIDNRQALWEQEYQTWEYNLNCDCGDGWILAATHGEK